ncbi:MAG: hypothetical protein A3G18_12960 [Rhodospirillales bacterium RIFCSPLOWO2_12_FULL_58_28]|nr:MAG: hypothetical protein A3H92_12815 [Rhodospirillales bacterium RIFCSPLOWO2_02_FULL_58_16]OHC78494.1 MAG: hypothetical protein A3G18_12960 [Rhodospirillales bacterium RIFCSPLOWO2_12_FULL_58_28]
MLRGGASSLLREPLFPVAEKNPTDNMNAPSYTNYKLYQDYKNTVALPDNGLTTGFCIKYA